VRHDIGTVYVQEFDTALANSYGDPGGVCSHARTCGLQLAVEHNGDVYSCDHFVEPDFLLGNLADTPIPEMVVSARQRKFGRDKRDTLSRFCLDCVGATIPAPVAAVASGSTAMVRRRDMTKGEPCNRDHTRIEVELHENRG